MDISEFFWNWDQPFRFIPEVFHACPNGFHLVLFAQISSTEACKSFSFLIMTLAVSQYPYFAFNIGPMLSCETVTVKEKFEKVKS